VPDEIDFSKLGRRRVRGDWSGGMITSDGGALIWRELEQQFGIIEQMANCFADDRAPGWTEFSLQELLAQRIFGILHGYEDLNDHDDLRGDHGFATAVGREDPEGMDRRLEADRGDPMAGKSTLNRLELAVEDGSPGHRYKKVVADLEELGALLGQLTLELIEQLYGGQPGRIVIDLDPSDVLLYGKQEGRYYHGYYQEHCYLPLYAFLGEWPMGALLRRSGEGACSEALETIEKLVERIREAWSETTIVFRGDSDFSKVPELMEWVEQTERVEYVFGLQRNSRLEGRLEKLQRKARRECEETGEAARRYRDFSYKTRSSWSKKRRVVGKAEYLPGDGEEIPPKSNNRFVVTSIDADEMDARESYEDGYCPRGNTENHIQETQCQLFGGRLSTHWESSNQLRMYLSSFALLFVGLLRKIGLEATALEEAKAETIRSCLLKVAAQVEVTHRNVWFRYSSHFPFQRELAAVVERIRAGPGR
jgi:hypothetical protein